MMESTETQTSPSTSNNLEIALTLLKQKIRPTLTTDPDYIPIRGVRHQNIETDDFDLDQYMDEFFAKERKVMLMLGDSGAGKSVYAQFLMRRLWQQYLTAPDKNPLPLFISLPLLKDPVNHAIEEILESYGLNAEQISELKAKQKFIFILDAYDEIRKDKNLFVTNKLGEWNAKIVITCRTQYLFTLEHYNNYFMPYENEKAVPWLFTEVYLKPFNQNQIESYLQQYVAHHDTEWKDWQVYLKHIDEIPGLKKLIQTPFLLKLAVEAMPEVIKLFAAENKKEEGDKQKLLKMTQAKLYDVFITQWFDRQEKKLKDTKQIPANEDIKPKFWEYAKGLAKELHMRNLTQIVYEPNEDLFGEDHSENPFEKYFDERDEKTHLLRTAALLQQTGKNQYAFFHSSLTDYFVTRDLYDTASQHLIAKPNTVSEKKSESKQEAMSTQKIQKNLENQAPESWLKDHFNQKLITRDGAKLQYLIDRVQDDEAFKRHMFDLIGASKKTEAIKIAAANAITVLNCVRVSFSGVNLAGIKIPGAILDEANFDYADLRESDWREVRAFNIRLSGADLRGSRLEKIDFVERPFWSMENNPYHLKKIDGFIAYSPDGKSLAITSDKQLYLIDIIDKKKIRKIKIEEKIIFDLTWRFFATYKHGEKTFTVYDINRAKNIGKFSGHTEQIESLVFNPNGQLIASCSHDHSVRVWDLKTQKLRYKFEVPGSVVAIDFSPDAKYLAGGGSTLWFWDMETGKVQQNYSTYSGITALCFSPDGQQLAIAINDTINLLNVQYNHVAFKLKGHSDSIFSMQFIEGGKFLLSADQYGQDNTISMWNSETGTQLLTFPAAHFFAYDPLQKILAANTQKGEIHFYDLQQEKSLLIHEQHKEAVKLLLFDERSQCLFSWSQADKTIKSWEVLSGKAQTLFTECNNVVAFSPDFQLLGMVRADNQISLYDTKLQKLIISIPNTKEEIDALQFDPTGRYLVSVAGSGEINLYETGDYKIKKCFLLDMTQRSGYTAAFSSDGQLLAVGAEKDFRFVILDTISAEVLHCLDLKKSSFFRLNYPSVRRITFSPGNQFLMLSCYQGCVLIDVVLGKTVYYFYHDERHRNYSLGFCFLSEKLLLAANNPANAKLINLENLSIVRDKVFTEDFSIHGCSLYKNYLAVMADKVLKIFDIQSWKCISEITGFANHVDHVLWHNPGEYLALSSRKIVQYWRMIKGPHKLSWQLAWSSHVTLDAKDCRLDKAMGLDLSSYTLLSQYGAIGKPGKIVEEQSKIVPLPAIKSVVKATLFSPKEPDNKITLTQQTGFSATQAQFSVNLLAESSWPAAIQQLRSEHKHFFELMKDGIYIEHYQKRLQIISKNQEVRFLAMPEWVNPFMEALRKALPNVVDEIELNENKNAIVFSIRTTIQAQKLKNFLENIFESNAQNIHEFNF